MFLWNLCRRDISIVTVTPDVDFLFLDVNALSSHLHVCVWVCDPSPQSVPPFNGLSFCQMIWTNINHAPTKGMVVSAKWFTMNWCIEILFSLGSSMRTLSNTHQFVYLFSVMPFSCQSSAVVKNFIPLCSKSLQTKYTVHIHVRPYKQWRFSFCIGCCLKCRISTKMFVFVQEQEVL